MDYEKDLKRCFYAIIALVVLLAASIVLNIIQYNDLHDESNTTIIEKEVHDTITVTDTLIYDHPVPEYIKQTKYIKVPVEKTDTINDTVYIDLPMTEKVYKDDSTYECQVSGYEPNLDYIKVFPKTTIITNEKIITQKIKYKPHFNFGLQSGLGYGITSKKFDLYVGAGVQYSF